VSFTDIYLERLEPWLSPDLAIHASAIGQMFEQIYGLVTDVGVDGDPGYMPGWGILFDVDTCPAQWLPYLGQFVGVPNLIGVDPVTARAQIKAQVSMHRGTPQSIINAASATLTGTQTAILTERFNGDPYAIQMITYGSETPDQAMTLAAMLTMKPAGIVLTYDVFTGWIISAMETFFTGDTITFLEGQFASITDYESHV
jgi:hypothetical protein